MIKQNLAHGKAERTNTTHKLNWLRASVLGADDGIVSVAGLVMGVAGATNSTGTIFAAGLAGIIAGSISMAAGEFVSVSSSRDTEKALLKKERFELENFPQEELSELTRIYEQKGLSHNTAKRVALELSKNDAFAAHAHAELNIDPQNLTNPWHAAFASAMSFLAGAIIPLLTILLTPLNLRLPLTFISVAIALGVTGFLSAKIGDADSKQAILRVVTGGVLAMLITYFIGKMFAVSGL